MDSNDGDVKKTYDKVKCEANRFSNLRMKDIVLFIDLDHPQGSCSFVNFERRKVDESHGRRDRQVNAEWVAKQIELGKLIRWLLSNICYIYEAISLGFDLTPFLLSASIFSVKIPSFCPAPPRNLSQSIVSNFQSIHAAKEEEPQSTISMISKFQPFCAFSHGKIVSRFPRTIFINLKFVFMPFLVSGDLHLIKQLDGAAEGNYMHMGAGKAWYGVPRDAAVAFEEVIGDHGYGGEINPIDRSPSCSCKTGKIINIKKGQFRASSVQLTSIDHLWNLFGQGLVFDRLLLLQVLTNSAKKVRFAGNQNVMVVREGPCFDTSWYVCGIFDVMFSNLRMKDIVLFIDLDHPQGSCSFVNFERRKAMFEKARRNSRHGAPWLKACVPRHVTPEARHGIFAAISHALENAMTSLWLPRLEAWPCRHATPCAIWNLDFREQIHKYVNQEMLLSKLSLATALVDMYANCGQLEKSKNILNIMTERDIISILRKTNKNSSSTVIPLFSTMRVVTHNQGEDLWLWDAWRSPISNRYFPTDGAIKCLTK
ncbi:hypothetical protein OSB04_014497 [Centaurea solstitialis]|uniref:Uncharacterized protein n=1 Tax=Centaurea solstitialis TaxID=347529 RepID=A0AA38TFH6_9ASTR|nr:hypothetical protein OSB04_014497 [Centaurea solstitialis]